MSTILKALKKSEQERNEQHIPSLADMPAPAEPQPWRWIVIGFCTMLIFTLVLYALWNLFASNEPTDQSPAAATSAQGFVPAISVISYSHCGLSGHSRFIVTTAY